jgi:hypothetical protein
MNRLGHPSASLRVTIVLLLGSAIGCNHVCASPPNQTGRDEQQAKEARMKDGQPFEIQLTCSGAGVKAVLINRSQAALPVMRDVNQQPSQLKLVSAEGKKVRYFDDRALMKFDNTPYCYLFGSLAPKEKLELANARFTKAEGGYAASWGPYSFDKVPPGEYRAQVTWRSELEACFDEETQQLRKLPGAWLGTVQSNEVTLKLK